MCVCVRVSMCTKEKAECAKDVCFLMSIEEFLVVLCMVIILFRIMYNDALTVIMTPWHIMRPWSEWDCNNSNAKLILQSKHRVNSIYSKHNTYSLNMNSQICVWTLFQHVWHHSTDTTQLHEWLSYT